MPVDEKADLERAYRKVLAKDPSRKIDIQDNLHTDKPAVGAAFKKAHAGIDVVNDDTMTAISGRQTHVYRSNPSIDMAFDFSQPLRALLNLVDKKIRDGKFSDQDLKQYNEQIIVVAKMTHLDEDQIWTMTTDYENRKRNLYQNMIDDFGGGKPSKLKSEIGETLVYEALGGKLSKDDQKVLDRNMVLFAHRENMSLEQATALRQTFERDVRLKGRALRESAVVDYNGDVQDRITAQGKGYTYSTYRPEDHMVVARQVSGSERALLKAWCIDPNDPPGRKPPGYQEMGLLLTALHESAHIEQGISITAPADFSNEEVEQASEINGDYVIARGDGAVLKFLKDAGEPDTREYWLQMREVNSFKDALYPGGKDDDRAGHDTATFLRVLEKTGKQIDLKAFDEEKRGLMNSIKARLDVADAANIKTGNIMGAVRDILAEDKNQTDPAKKLSDVQKAEAESFMRDATAMGYTANAVYPAPKPLTAPAPFQQILPPPPPQ